MNELKYQTTQIVFLILLGLGTYWAFTHLDTGVRYERDQLVVASEARNDSPDQTISIISNENILSNDSVQAVEKTSETQKPEQTTPAPDTNNSTSLISDLTDIASSGSIIQSGASGNRVEAIQEFLSIYFSNKNIVVDGDFGPTTAQLVKDFQSQEIGGGDGRVGPNTLGSMVEWLENN